MAGQTGWARKGRLAVHRSAKALLAPRAPRKGPGIDPQAAHYAALGQLLGWRELALLRQAACPGKHGGAPAKAAALAADRTADWGRSCCDILLHADKVHYLQQYAVFVALCVIIEMATGYIHALGGAATAAR